MLPDEGFLLFWEKYPRHDAKKEARKAWARLNPSPALVQQILDALAWQVLKDDWQRDEGQFIPLPASWLRGERWDDEQRSGMDRRVSQGGIVYECPHDPACASRWACGTRQLQERQTA